MSPELIADAALKILPVVVGLMMAIVLGIMIFPMIPALRDIFRGGPRPPSHPLPGDDSHLLNRLRAKSATHW